MSIEQAIAIATEYQLWRRGEGKYGDDEAMPEPMPFTPKELGKALDVLIEHAKHTMWQPIETLPEDAEDILLCVKGGIYVTNAVRYDDDEQWDIVSNPAYGTIEDPKKVYGFWMPAINPPKTENK